MKIILRIYLLIVIILSSSLSLSSQEYVRYGIVDGLSTDEITCVCQDKNYYWIGTTDGLCRFDGQSFKVYNKSGDKKGLLSNNIETLTFDSDGRIWIGYKTKGVEIFCPQEEKFYSLSELTDDKLPHHVISIFEDSQKNIWLGSWEEGVFLVKNIDHTKRYQVTNHYYGYTVSSFLENPKGFVWIGTYYGGFIYNLKKKIWQTFGNNNTISSIVSRKTGSVLYSTWNKGIHQIQYSVSDTILVNKDDEYYSELSISKMTFQDDQTLIAGTWGTGLVKIKLKNSIPNHQALVPYIQENIYVNNLNTDNNGTVWVSTYGSGLLKISDNTPIIQTISLPNNIQSPISKLYELNNQKMIVGTRGSGNFIYDILNRSFIPLKSNKKTIVNAYLLSATQTSDLLVIGDDDQGLSYRTDEYSPDEILYYGDQLNKISSIYNDGNKFWIGTKQNGFFSATYNSQSADFENVKQYGIIGRDEITGFQPYGKKMWIASHNGLFLYNPQTDEIENYGTNPVNEAVYTIVKTPSSDIIWLATTSGILYYNPKVQKIESLFPSSILPSGAVKTLKIDPGHNLWFTIGCRLFCYKKEGSRLFEIDLKKFITSPIITIEVVSDSHADYLYIGSSNGIVSINLQELFKANSQQKIIFTDLDVDLRNIQVGDTVYGSIPLHVSTENISKLDLSYQCKWISFHFSELGDNILKNQYQYRIVGFSDEWKSFNITQPLTLSQLPPGNYFFEIKIYSGNELDVENVIWSVELNIIPPFWQTFWFFLLVILVIISALIALIYMLLRNYRQKITRRIQRERRQHELDLLKEKESFFMGLSHDILTPFMMIQSPAKDMLSDSDLSEDNKDRAKIIYKNANFLSNMFHTIFDFKKTQDGILESDITVFDLISFAENIVNSFMYLARSKEISLKIIYSEILSIRTDKIKLERILYNLLSNALKYTPRGGCVSLHIMKRETSIDLVVEDNGVGIALEEQGRVFEKFYQVHQNYTNPQNNFGLGLYIVRSFVSQIGGDVILNSEIGKGTCIHIKLPIDIIVEINSKIDSILETSDQGLNISDNSKPILLLVEDNSDLNNYLTKILSEDFNVIAAKNGLEALNLAKEIIPEIILSDSLMPEMDGLTLCRKIKEDDLLSDCFFVLLTAKNSSEDEIFSYKQGVDVFLKKPIDADSLKKQLTNIALTRLKRRKQIMNTLLLQKGDVSKMKPKDAFIRELMKIVDDNMVNPDFKLDDLAEQMHLSKTVLHRKFKDILDETPNQFIRNIRLKKAENLLLNSDLTVSEIAYLTGFNQSHYFIKCFKEVYGDTPKNYRQKGGKNR